MALGTEEATFNAAVDTLIAAFETMVDALDPDEVVQICWIKSLSGDNPNNSKWGDADSATQLAKFNTGVKDRFSNNPDVTGDVPLEVGGKPLFFKVTNDAGDLT
jgi:hypothetical protein